MHKIRIIPRLDIKGENLVKGINMEGLRIIGKPEIFSKQYYESGADEILYIDTVASLYGRNSLHKVVARTAKEITIPLIVGGGLNSIDEIKKILKYGADKIILNTAAVKNPEFITEAAHYFGSSTIVVAIDYKSWPDDSFVNNTYKTVSSTVNKDDKKWDKFFQVYIENGRQQTGLNALEWAIKSEEKGAGEIFLNCIDKDGTQKGSEKNLTKKLNDMLEIPIVIGGGIGHINHVISCCKEINPSGLSIGSALHYKKFNISELKNYLIDENIDTVKHDEN